MISATCLPFGVKVGIKKYVKYNGCANHSIRGFVPLGTVILKVGKNDGITFGVKA